MNGIIRLCFRNLPATLEGDAGTGDAGLLEIFASTEIYFRNTEIQYFYLQCREKSGGGGCEKIN